MACIVQRLKNETPLHTDAAQTDIGAAAQQGASKLRGVRCRAEGREGRVEREKWRVYTYRCRKADYCKEVYKKETQCPACSSTTPLSIAHPAPLPLALSMAPPALSIVYTL